MPPKPSYKTVYHEKQVKLQCGKHAMNALLGEEKYVQKHGDTEIDKPGGKVNIYGICRLQHAAFAKQVMDISAEYELDPELLNDLILETAAADNIPCTDDGNFISETLIKSLQYLGYGIGRRIDKDTQDGISLFDETEIASHIDAHELDPQLLGYLINIKGWHWIAISASVGCPEPDARFFVIDSMAKKPWYINNCSGGAKLKVMLSKALKETAEASGEDEFGAEYKLRGAVIPVFKTADSYACVNCSKGPELPEIGEPVAAAGGAAAVSAPKSANPAAKTASRSASKKRATKKATKRSSSPAAKTASRSASKRRTSKKATKMSGTPAAKTASKSGGRRTRRRN